MQKNNFWRWVLKSLCAVRFYVAAVLTLPVALAHAAPAPQSSEEDELTQVYGDADSVSIATGSARSLRRAPAVASVITAADIAAMGATDLDQVLESVAGIHVSRSANNYAPLYVVRGIVSQESPQVLVLQDGVPITVGYTGNKGNLWGGYPVDHIARIEVMRGPGSALYGSDAFSGVINIITKTAADTPGTELGARDGSFHTHDLWVQHGGDVGPVDVSAYVRVGQTAGYKSVIGADTQSFNDGVFGSHASLAPGSVNVGNHAIDANFDAGYGNWRARLGYKLRDDLGTGAGIASALDPVGQQRSSRLTSSLSWADPQFARDWGLGAIVSTQQYAQTIPVQFDLLPPGTVLPSGAFPNGLIGAPDFWERQLRTSGYADYSGFAQHRIRIGAGHDDINMYRTSEMRNFNYAPNGAPVPLPEVVDFSDTNPYIFPQRRKIDYLYLQDEWHLAKDWDLTAGLRRDHYSDFGNTTNPRAALVWDASFDLTAKLLYGRAFRAPSFNESYSITNPVALGNPKLKPETNNTLETSFAWQARADATVNLTLYRYDMENIIRTVPNLVPGTGATYANTGDQTGHGVEIEGNWTVSRELRVSGNYAWQRSVDESTNTDAGYAPHHHAFGRADWQFGSGYLLTPQLNWVADRHRAAGDARPQVPDYTTLDLTLSTRRGKDHWDFSLSVRNLFNADAREPSIAPGTAIPYDLPLAPRALSLQAVYKL